MKMSFEEFQLSRCWCDNLATDPLAETVVGDFEAKVVPGFVYLGVEGRPMAYIRFVGGRFDTEIQGYSQLDLFTSLDAAERMLYEYLIECGLVEAE